MIIPAKTMRWASLFAVCLVPAFALGADAAPAMRGKEPHRTMCKASEIALFDCDMRNTSTVASVCQRNRQVIFRLSTWWGDPDLEVVSNGRDGRARSYVGRMGGNPNGIGASAKQYTIRFNWRGLDFYSHVTHGGSQGIDSGLAIEKDNVLLANGVCKTTSHPDFKIPDFVDEETDEKHRGLY